MASGRYATRTILVMRDAQNNDEIVCRGDATTCARLIGTSSKNVMSAYKRHGKCKGKYIFEFAGYEEVRPNANRVTAKDLRMLRIVPEDSGLSGAKLKSAHSSAVTDTMTGQAVM